MHHSTKTWGNDYLSLRLPTGDLRLDGLSAWQCQALADEYSFFVPPPCAKQDNSHCCRASVLPQPLSWGVERFTVDGQYCLEQRDCSDGLALRGHNFEANLEFNGAGGSTLAVFEERELVNNTVIENFLRVYSAYQALPKGGIMLHSAGFVVDGRAYIFCGRSGVGKTTLTRKAYAMGAEILSDDINLLLPGKDGYEAYAVPFTGEFGRTLRAHSSAKCFPVACIALLDQGRGLAVDTPSRSLALARMFASSPFVNCNESQWGRLFDVYERITADIPVIHLTTHLQDSVSEIFAAISKVLNDDV